MVLLSIQNIHRHQYSVEHADGRHRSGSKDLLKDMIKAGLPRRQLKAEGAAELSGVEPRVGRAFGGRRVVSGGDGLDRFRLHIDWPAHLDSRTDDVAGVVTPVGLAAGNAVIGAVGKGVLIAALLTDEVGGEISQQGS